MTRAVCLSFAAAAFLLVAPPAHAQEQAAPGPSVSVAPGRDAKRDEALAHFELGLTHFDRAEWSAALAEFLQARDLYPTRAATKNAAICMRHENRFDDALEMFEALLRDYPDLSPTDRALADAQIADLARYVGSLAIGGGEPGANVVVDGRERGLIPLRTPIRVSVGSHVVRVSREGFSPFERRVEIASGRATEIDAHLEPLLRSGRVRVVEQAGRRLSVVIDGVEVGKTPWEGIVAPGTHSVLLRGEGNLGAQPVVAPVSLDEETAITLVAEELDASARIEPTPAGALVAIDGASVGRGVWEGRLRSGLHRIEVTAEGFLPAARRVSLGLRGREVVPVVLERDPLSPVWGKRARGRFGLEFVGAFGVAPSLGGDVSAACTGACTSTVPRGGLGLVRATFELPQGLGFGVEAGGLGLGQFIDERAAKILGPALRAGASDSGTVNDVITLNGLLLGGAVSYRRGDAWTVTLRLAVGAYVATVTDVRNGQFTTSNGEAYSVGALESHGAAYLYVAPEVRVGRRIGDHWELGAGLQVLVLATPAPPAWSDQTPVLAAPATMAGDGLGGFGAQTLTGRVLAVVAPEVGARYDF